MVKRILPGELTDMVERGVDRLIAIILLASACLWFALLFDYSTYDPSWNTSSVIAGDIKHFLGSFGAHTADMMHQTLGIFSYVFSLFLIGVALRLWAGRRLQLIWRFPVLLIGIYLLSVSCSQLLGLRTGSIGLLGFYKLSLMVPPLSLNVVQILSLGLGSFLILLGSHIPLSIKGFKDVYKGVIEYVDHGIYVIQGIKKFVLPKLINKIPKKAVKRKPVQLVEPSFMPQTQQEEQPAQLALFEEEIVEEEKPFEEEKDAGEEAISNFKQWLKEKDKRKKPAAPSKKQRNLFAPEISGDYNLPHVDLLDPLRPKARISINEEDLHEKARQLETVLSEYGVKGEIVNIRPGPVVTMYELVPAPGIKTSRVIGLAEDIARSMSALSARIAVIPGKNVIGIELPNKNRETVYMRELLQSEAYAVAGGNLGLILGKDIGGNPVVADLARMPHLLVAGTTGSGKSVSVNTMILSLLFKYSPEQCKFILIDPKMLEFSIYNDIPHLLTPVVTDPKKAVVALKWAVKEMENRYRAMSKLGVRNIDGYNSRLVEAKANGEILQRKVQTGFDPDSGKPIFETQNIDLTPLPYIVVVVDEMADLMLVAGKEIESAVQRLAQMARAAGIHLIMATQRPSVDVITGTIKANFPTRISFMVTSKIDSRTILGEQGAEQLLGQGDMLFMAGGGRIQRVHGPFVRDEEVERIVQHLKAQGEPSYIESVTQSDDEDESAQNGEESEGDDLYKQAVELVYREGKASTSFIQRHLQIGYNRAARIIDQMEKQGIVSAANHVGKREIIGKQYA